METCIKDEDVDKVVEKIKKSTSILSDDYYDGEAKYFAIKKVFELLGKPEEEAKKMAKEKMKDVSLHAMEEARIMED